MGSAISNLVSGGGTDASSDMQDALRKAQQQMQQYYGQATGYMQPFQQAGVGAMGQYQTALSGMSDPHAFYQQMMQGYNTSPQAQFQQQQALKASNQAAAAGGTVGSGQQQKELADWTQQLTSRDQQQWLQNMMGINQNYMGGLSGLMQQGYGAAGQMGNWGMDTGKQMSSLQSDIGQAQAFGDESTWGGINSLMGGAAGGLFGTQYGQNMLNKWAPSIFPGASGAASLAAFG